MRQDLGGLPPRLEKKFPGETLPWVENQNHNNSTSDSEHGRTIILHQNSTSAPWCAVIQVLKLSVVLGMTESDY